MIRVALVEDSPLDRQKIQDYLSRYGKEHGETFQISAFEDGADIINNYSNSYDIILMDIELKIMDGMTAAENIRKLDSDVVIIFITNMAQYAIKGYLVEALDYVLKPISYYMFAQKIERALKRMAHRRNHYAYINIGKNMKKLELSQLYYVEVQGHTLTYHTTEGNIITYGSISEVEQNLNNPAFFRCNKCYLVNLEHVENVVGSMAIVGGEQVQISRAKKKSFLDTLNNYINEVSK